MKGALYPKPGWKAGVPGAPACFGVFETMAGCPSPLRRSSGSQVQANYPPPVAQGGPLYLTKTCMQQFTQRRCF